MTRYLEDTGYFCNCQFGFRRGLSCEYAVLDLVEGIRKDMLENKVVLAAFEDYTIAFNCVFCSTIVDAAVAAGFSRSAAKVLVSMLTGRRLQVVTPHGVSTWRDFFRGIGQGGKLGPLLYILAANTYPGALAGGCRCHLLADDSTIELPSMTENLNASLVTLQVNLESVERWSASAGLVLNPGKTVLACFGSARNVAIFHRLNPSVVVGGVTVRPSCEVKYLGVWLSEDLSWGRQARALTARCIGAIRAVARFRGALDTGVRLMLARSLALVHLDYCSSVLTSADARTMERLQVAQNCCIRFICEIPRHGHVTEHRKRLALLRPRTRVRLKCLILFHRLVYANWPPALLSTISLVSGDQFRRGRSLGTRRFVLPRCPSEAGRMTFHFSTVREWNALPERIRCEKRPGAFKRAVSAFLVANES